MSDEKIKQKAVKRRGFGSPETRGALFIGLIILIVLIGAGIGAYSFLTPDSQVAVKTGRVDASNVRVEADAHTSEAYKDAKREENSERYEQAKTAPGGVALPFTFDEEPQGGEDGKDINNCGCTINDQQLMDAIKRLGIANGDSDTRDHMRVGKSDVYIATNGQLMGEDGEPLLFRSSPIFMESSGQLLDEKGISVLSKDKEPLYLGKDGDVIDRQARTIPLLGDLLMSSGALYINDGRLAIRPGNMQRIGRSDIYVTTEGQLVTMDGKPVRHSGAFVYQNDERKLINRNTMDVAWEQQSVYQNKTGQLVNVSGEKFIQPGILFSYGGILIDNDGMLTRPLVNIEKIGNSDIYKTKSGNLVDGYGLAITHYGAKVRIGPNDKLLTTTGQPVFNRTKAEVYLTDKGALRADVGKGGIQSGILKSSEGVAIDRHGQMITRRGRLERRGSSDIYLTADGLLSDKDGKPIHFLSKDAFIDFSAILQDGSQGLETFDQIKVVDKAGRRVYLTLEGRIVDAKGNSITDIGILSSSDGVLITSSGKKVIQDNEMERVVTKDGQLVTYNGKEVFKGKDGRLYDADGNPILTPDGRAVFMDENGNLVDEFGRVVDNIELMAGERAVKNGELSTRKKLTTTDGERILHDGKEVFVDASGRVIDENGNAILTKDGREIFVDANGNIVDKNGNKVDESILKTEAGKTVSTGLVAGREQVVTKDGKAVKYKGRDVFKGEDGALYDEHGNAITTKDGRRVFIDSEGNMVDEDGNIITEDLLTAGNKPVKSGQLTSISVSEMKKVGNSDIYVARDGTLLDKNGKAITFNGKKVRVGKNGQLFDENGNPVIDKNGKPVFINAQGELVDSKGNKIDDSLLTDGDGVLLDSTGKSVTASIVKVGDSDIYKTSDGRLVDKDGKAIKFNGENVFVGDDGRLYYENGKLVTDKNGNSVYLDPATGRLVDRNGKSIEGNVITTSDGTLIDSNGELVTSGGKLKRIPGTDLYRTEDGQVVDSEGKPVMVNGEPVFVDESGKVVNKYGKPVRFKGQELYIAEDGRLVDRNGQPVLDDNNRSIRLSDDGGIVNEDGESVDKSTGGSGVSGFKKTVNPEDSNIKPAPNAEIETTRNATGEVPPEPKTTSGKKQPATGEVQGIRLDQASAERLQRRYSLIKTAMRNQLMKAQQNADREVGLGFVAVGGKSDSGLPESGSNTGADDTGSGSKDGENATDDDVIFQKAGSMLYAVTSYQINSDYIKEIMVGIVGLSPKHPLYNAKAMGKFELAYDRMVLTFDKVCPLTGECVPMKGVALDPGTSAAALASDVDHHYWYRYGGLFLSSLLAGTAEAMSESGTREETTSVTGTKVTTTGLDGDKLVLRSFGKVGESFSEAFADNINRPPTAWIDPGEEMAIMLFDDIKGSDK
jgi:flagellar basal body rod protein FlgG